MGLSPQTSSHLGANGVPGQEMANKGAGFVIMNIMLHS